MNVIQEIRRINERELAQGLSGKASWHHEYKDSAWVFAGGFPYDLTEGDLLCVMSQWGEIEDINLCREKDTGKSKGFCFVKYEDQRSTILAVDNFNGIELLGRTIRVDHKHKYSLPAEVRDKAEKEEEERVARGEEPSNKGAQWRPGVAYEGKELATAHNFHKGVDVFAAPEKDAASSDDSDDYGVGSAVRTESAAEKQQRRQRKKERKEARAAARERKKDKASSKRKNDGRESERDHRDDKLKHKKHHKKSKHDQGPQAGNGPSRGDRLEERRGEYVVEAKGRHRDDNFTRNGTERGSSKRGDADAPGAWERGARAPGGGGSGDNSAPFAPSQASGRPAAPAPLMSGNVMDWRGLGGRSAGGRGGEGRGRSGRGSGRGGREGGRGAGRGGRGGGDGMNSLGGMDRRR